MKKGFTLIELLATVTILIVIIAIVVGIMGSNYNEDNFDYSYLNPQYESAKNSRKIAEQLERQNDLMERQLEQQKNAEKNQ